MRKEMPSMKFFRAALGWFNVAYLFLLVILLAALEWWGERSWIVSALLYVPPQVWLLPLAVLVPAGLFLRPRLCVYHIVCILFVGCVFMRVRWHSRPVHNPEMLTLVTNNFGQNNHQSLDPLIGKENPDIVVLQDAPGASVWARKFPERFVSAKGEFLTISKYPIKSAAFVPSVNWRGKPVAVRLEISFNGHPLVVYSVHLPTPRPDFAKLRGTGLLREFIGRNRRGSDGRSFSESMAARVEMAKQLRDVIAEERLPFIVAGDFNMPDRGYIYHLFASQFTDAFAKSGRGWGLTFPGSTHNPLTGFGPWMRLDQIFAGRGWEPVYCEAEPGRRSQHRAMIAIFRPMENP